MIPTTKKRNPLLIILGFVFVVSVASELRHLFFDPAPVSQQMMDASNDINKRCPIMIDSMTRLDNTFAIKGNKFIFNYTLINSDVKDIDVQSLQEELEKYSSNAFKTDPKFRVFRDNNVTISATFYDSSGKFVCLVETKTND